MADQPYFGTVLAAEASGAIEHTLAATGGDPVLPTGREMMIASSTNQRGFDAAPRNLEASMSSVMKGLS